MISLAEALKEGQLNEFIAQEEARGSADDLFGLKPYRGTAFNITDRPVQISDLCAARVMRCKWLISLMLNSLGRGVPQQNAGGWAWIVYRTFCNRSTESWGNRGRRRAATFVKAPSPKPREFFSFGFAVDFGNAP